MRFLKLASVYSLAMLMPWSALAQSNYPNHTVTIVVPAGPGGVLDVVARIIAQRLPGRLNQQFIVENRGGAGGNIGTGYVSKSAPDGHTLLFSAEAPLVINQYLYKSLGYDPLMDLAPITQVGFQSYYVVACPNLPATKLADLISLNKGKPLSYASIGFGTTMHLSGELMSKAMKMQMTHVPYRGVSPAIADVISCNVDVEFIAIGTAAPLIKGGQVKALAVSTTSRWPETPDVPTLRESGLPEMEQVESSFSLLAPAKTPRAIVELLQKEVSSIMSDESVTKDLKARGMRLVNSTPDQFAAWLASANESYRKIIGDANIEKID